MKPLDKDEQRGVALVLAGGGARGAYEVGALSVLLPKLKEAGEYPDIMIGTSVGALNVAYFAATADRAVQDLPGVISESWRIWLETDYTDVLRPLLSRRQVTRIASDIFDVIGLPGRFWSIFDPAPLAKTLHDLDLIPSIHRNVEAGMLYVAAVVATAAYSGRSVVFHDGGEDQIDPDPWRGIEYVKTPLLEEHVRASAAIPAAFPAQKVAQPAEGWYFDGGTRLNTPISPALKLGARKVIVIALNSPGSAHSPYELQEPDGYDGLSQIMQAVLVDPLVNDLKTLTTVNDTIKEHRRQRSAGAASEDSPAEQANELGDPEKRPKVIVPYIFVCPKPDAIGACASRVYNDRYDFPLKLPRSPSVSLLGHGVDAGTTPVRGELFSYLFFAREFAQELIKLGQSDAQAWLDEMADAGSLWRVDPMPPPRTGAQETLPPGPPKLPDL
jgi:NTE family protein